MPDIPARKDVPEDQTWNVAAVFPTRQDWEDGFKKAALLFPALQQQFEGHLGDSPEILLDWLEKKQPAFQLFLRLEQYAYLNYSVDTSNPEGSEMYGRISSLGADCAAAFAFEEPELMSIGFEKIKSWIKQNPNLALYAHFFDILERKAAHVRSSEVEVLLSQVQDPFQAASEIHGILVNADLHFKPAIGTAGEKSEVTHSKTRELLTSSDRKLRRNGWKSYADGHLAFKNTMANCLAAGMKQDAFFAKARRYSSSLEFSLESVDLPVSVFHNVVNAFKANLPVWHRYWDLRRKVMGMKKLSVYDTYAAFSDKKVDIPYNQAVEWISAGLQPLGREYVEIVRKGATSDRWVDRAANKGKQFGAFSYGANRQSAIHFDEL